MKRVISQLTLICRETVEQRLDLLVSLSLRNARSIRDLEELRGDLCKPAWLDSGDYVDAS